MIKIDKGFAVTKATKQEKEILEGKILKGDATVLEFVIYADDGWYILVPNWAKYCIFDKISEVAYFSKRKEVINKTSILIHTNLLK